MCAWTNAKSSSNRCARAAGSRRPLYLGLAEGGYSEELTPVGEVVEADDEVGADSEEVKVKRSPEVSFESEKRLSTSALAALLPFFDFCAE